MIAVHLLWFGKGIGGVDESGDFLSPVTKFLFAISLVALKNKVRPHQEAASKRRSAEHGPHRNV